MPSSPSRPTRARRGVFVSRVKANESICREHWRLTLEVDGFPKASPGQFVQILCAEPPADASLAFSGWQGGAYIRRPFSIGGLRRSGDGVEIDILHRAIGVGTIWLSKLHAGDHVSILGPLGTPFALPDARTAVYLVGGGIGLPPLIWLAEYLRDINVKTIAFVGARTADLLPLPRDESVTIQPDEPSLAFQDFSRCDTPVVVATDDGSLGRRGTVVDAFADYTGRQTGPIDMMQVYTCGPERMMHATAMSCIERGVACQVCLERMMACGMGTCQSCVVPIRDIDAPDGWRYRLCCSDGPVFDARTVIWGEPPDGS